MFHPRSLHGPHNDSCSAANCFDLDGDEACLWDDGRLIDDRDGRKEGRLRLSTSVRIILFTTTSTTNRNFPM